MVRGKVSMELISNETSRKVTFQKRQNGLKKKSYELSTLCDAEVCVIIYGPKQNDHPTKLIVWPENPDQVERLIVRYKQYCMEKRWKRSFDLSDFFKKETKKVEKELVALRNKNAQAKYPMWDERINYLSIDQLREFHCALGNKLEMAKARIEMLKGSNQIEEPTSGMIDCPIASLDQIHSYKTPESFQKSMGLENTHQHPISSSFVHQMLQFDQCPTVNQTTYDNNCPQFGNIYSSNIQYSTPPNKLPIYQDPAFGMLENTFCNNSAGPSMKLPIYQDPAFGMLENTFCNNSGPSTKLPIYQDPAFGMLENTFCNNSGPSMNYYTPSTTQPMLPNMQNPEMSSLPSQMHTSQMKECYDFGDLDGEQESKVFDKHLERFYNF